MITGVIQVCCHITFMRLLIRLIQVLLFLGTVGCESRSEPVVIGIFTTRDQDFQQWDGYDFTGFTFVRELFVSMGQMAGAKVIPISGYRQKEYYDRLLPQINGVMFEGGGEDLLLNRWTQNAQYILNYTISQFSQGRIFPLWGVCLGLELLAYVTNDCQASTISPVFGDHSGNNTLDIQPNSYLFLDMPQHVIDAMRNQPGKARFRHKNGLLRSTFENSPRLQEFWEIESYSTTKAGDQIVSAMRSKVYPIFAMQFHPQNMLFNHGITLYRSEETIEFCQILIDRMLSWALRSPNRFKDQSLLQRMTLDNYGLVDSPRSFRLYLFKEFITFDRWKDEGQSGVYPSHGHSQSLILDPYREMTTAQEQSPLQRNRHRLRVLQGSRGN